MLPAWAQNRGLEKNFQKQRFGKIVVFAAIVLPVLAITLFSYIKAYHELTAITLARRQSIAYLAAKTLEEKFSRLKDVAVSLATRTRFAELVAQGQWEEAMKILEDVPAYFSYIDRIFLADKEGVLVADIPQAPEVRGKSFAYRDWYRGVSKEWKPYVSEIYKRAAEPRLNVVAVAVPVFSPARETAGILVLQVKIDTFCDWGRQVDVGYKGFVYFVDNKGQVAGHPSISPQGEIINFFDISVVQNVLWGKEGIGIYQGRLVGQKLLAAYSPILADGWGAIAAQPVKDAFWARDSRLIVDGIVAGFILVVTFLLAFLILRVMERQRQAQEQVLAAKNMAEAANLAKTRFLASMSHELRTPLNAIIGFSELLKTESFGPLNEKQKEYVHDVWESGRHLLSLINDILDLSKVEAGKMELDLETFSLKALLENSLAMIKEKAMTHHLGFLMEIDPDIDSICADERKVKQIIFNLLSNAVKFTPDGGQIGIKVRKSGPEEVTVSVWDTGIGIQSQDAGKVFEEFAQIKSDLSRQQVGTGLGMPLAKKFVELHGGRIWFESKGKNQGSCFSFTLPILPNAPKVEGQTHGS